MRKFYLLIVLQFFFVTGDVFSQDWFKSAESENVNQDKKVTAEKKVPTDKADGISVEQFERLHTGTGYLSDNGKTIYYDPDVTKASDIERLRVEALLRQQQLRQKQ